MPELQDTKEYIAATEKKTRKRPQRGKRDANYELPQPYGRAKDAHNVSRNDLSRLCKYDPLGSIAILHLLPENVTMSASALRDLRLALRRRAHGLLDVLQRLLRLALLLLQLHLLQQALRAFRAE